MKRREFNNALLATVTSYALLDSLFITNLGLVAVLSPLVAFVMMTLKIPQ